MSQTKLPKKSNNAYLYSIVAGTSVGLMLSIVLDEMLFFAIGLSVGVAIGYTLEPQNDEDE